VKRFQKLSKRLRWIKGHQVIGCQLSVISHWSLVIIVKNPTYDQTTNKPD